MTGSYDVLIVGAGPAGLSAALVLSHARRRVLLCGAGETRNHASHGIHGLLSHEGQLPADFVAAAARDLKRYPTLEGRDAEVVSLKPTYDGFEFACADGLSGTAHKVLLATGLRDELPPIPGVETFYGCSVHHCLYCDGFEYADKPIAAFGSEDKGAALALMMKQWSGDVMLCTGGGAAVGPEMQKRLAAHGIPMIEAPITRLEGDGSVLRRIRFADGSHVERDALFFSTGCHQKSDLWQVLGCVRDEKGGIVTDALTEETSVPGVYVAGDVSRDVLLIAVALAEGAKAAVAINRALLTEDGLI
jgi:thioredoxin reductase